MINASIFIIIIWSTLHMLSSRWPPWPNLSLNASILIDLCNTVVYIRLHGYTLTPKQPYLECSCKRCFVKEQNSTVTGLRAHIPAKLTVHINIISSYKLQKGSFQRYLKNKQVSLQHCCRSLSVIIPLALSQRKHRDVQPRPSHQPVQNV